MQLIKEICGSDEIQDFSNKEIIVRKLVGIIENQVKG
jgi:hypothetical protein